jgi:hypothetical protein
MMVGRFVVPDAGGREGWKKNGGLPRRNCGEIAGK